MANSRIAWIVLPAVVLAGAAWTVSHSISARAEGRPGQVKWEYAHLYIGDGKALFFEADRQSTVKPPLNPLSGNITRGELSGERYTIDAKSVRNHDIAALNYVGRQGWEAVSVTPKGRGLVILLKRSN